MLQGDQHGLQNRSTRKHISQIPPHIPTGKPIHRVHPIHVRSSRHNRPSIVNRGLHLTLHVNMTRPASTFVLARDEQIFRRSFQRRHFVPFRNLQVQRGHIPGTSPEQLQLHLLGRIIRRVKRREQFSANAAIEKHHALQDCPTRVHSTQRLLAQARVKLRDTRRDHMHRDH